MIPDKYFYTIGDVSQITGTKPHTLRYWEAQFKLLRPARRYSGHRKYTQEDIDLINRIKSLIIDRKFTLAGAKREISRQLNPRSAAINNAPQTPASLTPILQEIKKEVESCLEILQPAPKQQELVGLK